MREWTDRFDGEMAFRAPLGAAELGAIPARRGVFLLEGADGEPILLATAADIRSRMRFRLAPSDEKPSRRVDLRQVASRLRWKLADSHFETDWQFLELARAVHPDTYRDLLTVRAGWFVRVSLADDYPGFRPARDPGDGTGAHFGPFPDRRSARRFIEILQDVFDLCRREQVLRRGGGAGCAYAQMGRCLAPCRGRVSPAEYRRAVVEACRCAEGRREPVRQALRARMRRLADQQRYEQAGECKTRLDRLAELDRPEFAHAPAGKRFQYLLVQRGPNTRQAKVFLVDRGAIRPARPLAYPLRARQLSAALAAMRRFCGARRVIARSERERIALVSHYLFVSPQRRGVVLRHDDRLSAEDLRRHVESAAEALHLRPPRRGGPPRPE